MAALLEEFAWSHERVVQIPVDPGRFLADAMTFVPPRWSAVCRPVRSPTAVTPGNTAERRLRLAKPGEESGFNRLARHH